MIHRTILTEEQAKKAIEVGDLPSDITGAGEHVAVVLTQDWCPQWNMVQSWLDELAGREEPGDLDIHVFEFEYNKVDFFSDFLRFKEQVLGNQLIPYIRYYRNGIYLGDSNYVPQKSFLKRLTE